MSRRTIRSRRVLRFLDLESRITPIVSGFVGGAPGPLFDKWSVAENWTNGVPGPGDTALFANFGPNTVYQPSVETTVTVGSLSFASDWGGLLNVRAPLTVTGNSTWSTGTIAIFESLGGKLTQNGTLTMNNTTSIGLAGPMTNNGIMIQAGTGNLHLASFGSTNPTIDNAVGAVYDWQSDTQITYSTYPSGAGSFVNKGTLRRSVGTGTATFRSAFTLGGTVEVSTGQLHLAPAAVTGLLNGTTFNVSTGATLNLTVPFTTVHTSGAITASGGGSVKHGGGLLQLAGNTTFNFPAAMYQWDGGGIELSGLTLTNAASSVITVSNSAVFAIRNGTFINAGTMRQTGSGILAITGGATVLENAVGALYDIQSDTTISYDGYGSGSGAFSNKGILRRSVGTGVASIASAFTLSGTIDVQSGSLTLASTGGKGGLVSDAIVTVANNATLNLAGVNTTVNYAGTLTGSGAGTIRQGGGLVRLAANADWNFAGSVFQWDASAIDLFGWVLTNVTGSTITMSNSKDISLFGVGKLINNGTIRQTGTGKLGITGGFTELENAAGALYDLQSDSNIGYFGYGSGSGAFVNKGTLRRSNGTGTATLNCAFTLTGSIDVQSGTLTLQPLGGKGGFLTDANLSAAAGATLNMSGLNSAVGCSGAITGTGAGKIRIGDGLVVPVTDVTFNFTPGLLHWDNSGINLNGRVLTNAPGSVMTLSNSQPVSLFGVGKFFNAGTIRQSGAGNLTITGGTTVLENAAGALYDLQSDTLISYTGYGSGSGSFINKGTFRRSGGTGTATLQSAFTLSGNIEVQSGTLNLQSSGGKGGFVADAAITVSAGAVMNLSAPSATTNYSGLLTGSGSGKVRNGDGLVQLAGNAVFNFAPNVYHWDSSAVNLAGFTLTNAVGSEMTLSNNAAIGLFGNGTLRNAGRIRQMGTGNIAITNASTVLENAPGAVYDLESDTAITYTGYFSGAGRFTNKGLFRVTSTVGAVVCKYTNDGGTIDVVTGKLGMPNAIDLGGGTLTGRGTFDAPLTSNGRARPGTSPGTLTISFGYAQTATGALELELLGTSASTQYDQLAVNGGVSLGGDLKIGLGFTPAKNDSFIILLNDSTDAIVNTFNGLAEGATFQVGGATMSITYKGGTDNNDVVLTVTNVAVPPAPQVTQVLVNGGVAQRSRVTNLSVNFDSVVTLPAAPETAFQLRRQSDNAIVALAASLGNNGNSVVTLSFLNGPAVLGGSLADGRYTLTIDATKVSGLGGQLDGDANGTAGGNYQLIGTPANGLFRLFGDADGNGTVSGADFLAFRLSFLTGNSIFDYDGGGIVDGNDFLQFRLRFLQTV